MRRTGLMIAVSSSAFERPVLPERSLRVFASVVVGGWLILGAIAVGYARARKLPPELILPIALAFLTEYPFYILPGFGELRSHLGARLSRTQRAAGIAVTGLFPYLVCAFTPGMFRPMEMLEWLVILCAVACWFLILPGQGWTTPLRDLGFLALVAALILSGVLRTIFPAPIPRLPLEVLGHITLIRTAILSILLLRGAEDSGFGFIPRTREIAIGALWALVCAGVTLPLARLLGRVSPVEKLPGVLPGIGVFLGILWVVALSEEFFFRGLLQVWITRWAKGPATGLLITSALFGACHIGFGGIFPNWRFATLAMVLGLFCGVAFLHGRGIRASMVTHALIASAFRLFVTWRPG